MTLPAKRTRFNSPVLDPPPTPAELSWWRTVRRPMRRNSVLQGGLLVGGPVALSMAVRNGVTNAISAAALPYIGFGLGLAAVSGTVWWLIWRRTALQLTLTEKRIRDGLAREAAREAEEETGNGGA